MSRRRGFGIVIALAMLFVLIFAVSSLSLGRMESAVVVDVRTGRDVARARVLAQGALEELSFALEERANDPASPVYALFRDQVPRLAASGQELALPVDEKWLGVTREQVLPAYAPLKLGAITARVRDVHGFPHAEHPWMAEVYGNVALEVRVPVPGARGVVTQVTADRWLEFRVLRFTVVPPFDRPPLTLIDPFAWANAYARHDGQLPDENVNQLTARILEDDLTTADEQVAKLTKKLPEIRKAPGAGDAVKELEGGLADAKAALAAVADARAYFKDPSDFHHFQNPELRWVYKGDVKGDDLNLPALLKDLCPRRLALYDQTQRARKSLDAQLKKVQNASDLLPTLKELRRASVGLLRADREILSELSRVNERFVRRVGTTERVTLMGPMLDCLANGYTNAFGGGAAGVRVTAGRATWHVDSPGVKQKLVQLLAHLGKPFTGVIEVRNLGEELALGSADSDVLTNFEGRLILVVQGDLKLGTLTVSRGEPGGGTIQVIAHGALKAQGEVDAALVALGAFQATGPLKLRGSLLLTAAAFGREAVRENVLAGVDIAEDARIAALDPNDARKLTPASRRVVFGPRPVYETSMRGAGDAK